MVRDGLRALLEAQPDIRVIGDAADGREAVRRVEQLCPDVVVMDIAMPELNGIEATRKIDRACPATRVIILSMQSTPRWLRCSTVPTCICGDSCHPMGSSPAADQHSATSRCPGDIERWPIPHSPADSN